MGINMGENSYYSTDLHTAAASNQVDSVAGLLDNGADPSARDCNGQTPLHTLITGRNTQPTDLDCLKLLLNRNTDVNAQDQNGCSPLHLAALEGLAEFVPELIRHGGDLALRNNAGISALTMLSQNLPSHINDILNTKLDSGITFGQNLAGDGDQCQVNMDFSGLLPSLIQSHGYGRNLNGYHPIDDDLIDKKQQETGLLTNLISSGNKSVLEHPLAEAFLWLKWHRVRKFFYFTLAFQIIYAVFLTAYVQGIFIHICPLESSSTCSVPIAFDVLRYILCFALGVLVVQELFHFAHTPTTYFKNTESYLHLLLIGSNIMVLTGRTDYWVRPVAALGTFTTWISVLYQLGRFPVPGLYIAMLRKVAIDFCKLIAVYACVLIGFSNSLSILFPNYQPFTSLPLSFLKVLTMMIGEVDYEHVAKPDNQPFYLTGVILFIVFVLLVTMVMMNLLIGLAVHDIQGLQEHAKIDRLCRQTQYIARFESVIFSPTLNARFPRIMAWIHNKCALSSYSGVANFHNMKLSLRPNDPRDKSLPESLKQAALKLSTTSKPANTNKLKAREASEEKRRGLEDRITQIDAKLQKLLSIISKE